MLQSYNKLTLLDIDDNIGNIGGGVGKAYPGSTGGEIFNYYATDSLANTASGNYGTTIGRNNKNDGGEQVFMGGCGNKFTFTGTGHSDNNFIFGTDNEVGQNDPSKNMRTCIAFGYQNKIEPKNSISWVYLIGNNNAHIPSTTAESGACAAFGNKLKPLKAQYMYGCNNQTPVLSDTHLVLASGTTSSSATAIEASGSQCKIRLPLQLANDTTEVNAITPPQDPNNVTTDDQTLVTKSYIGASYMQTQSFYSAVDEASATLVPIDGSSLDLTTLTGTLPSWVTMLTINFKWEGETYTKDLRLDINDGLHLDAQQYDTSQIPTSVLEHSHVRMDFTAATTSVQAIDYWYYEHDITTNTIANFDYTLSNCPNIKILSIVGKAY